MRKKERDNPTIYNVLKPGNKEDVQSYKTRKGIVGDFKNLFDEEQINSINKVIDKTLSEFYSFYKFR